MQLLYEPVAVRHIKSLFLLFAAKRGPAIEEKIFEKAKKDSAEVEIFFRQMPLKNVASANSER